MTCFCSVAKQQQRQHIYDYVVTNPLATRVHNHPVKRSASNINDDIAMDVNPAYGTGAYFTNKGTEDVEYEVVDSQSRQMKTDKIKMDINPAYAETKFT